MKVKVAFRGKRGWCSWQEKADGRWRCVVGNGAQGALMCPSYSPAGREVGSTVIFFLMEYADSPHVCLENN